MPKTYKTEAKAFRRVAYLSRYHGIWPGVLRCGDGWQLTYDPDIAYSTSVKAQLKDVEAEYVEDEEVYAWLPMD
jgi:hypothetical protein